MFSIPQSIKPFLKKVSMKLRRLEAACFRQFHGKDVSFVFSRMPQLTICSICRGIPQKS